MLEGYLFRHCAPAIALSLWSGAVLLPSVAHAEVSLKLAVIESLRNAVELNRQNQAPRSAKICDTLVPGDALSTARAALAELRFNDGSLARVGGQALFRFLPDTRTFQLSNGTLLLLVPPGRGQTRIQTPNAAAGIHGSALFVRYLPATNATLIGALTESGIEITNRDRSQTKALRAGQIAVVVNDRIEQVYRFDLKTFYDTSELVKGLDLQRSTLSDRLETTTDQTIAAVRAETSEAAKTQARLDSFSGVGEGEQKPNLDANAAQLNQILSQPGRSSVEPTANSSTIALPTTSLLTPPTATLPTTIPPTVVLPTTVPLVNPPAALNPIAPGLALPPGTNPSQRGITPPVGLPPGLAGTTPGLAGTTPGQSGGLPPGLAGTTPGLAGTAPR